MAQERPHFLDRPAARLLAGLVFLAAFGFLGWLHRADLAAALGLAENAPADANPALAACLDERVGTVDRMRAEGVITDAQHATFRARAEALCAAEHPAEEDLSPP